MQSTVERFATDEESRETPSGASARMFAPADAVDWLERRDGDLADLLVDDARAVNLVSIGEENDGKFGIAPDLSRTRITDRHSSDGDAGAISSSIQKHGNIPLSEGARHQLCKLMGINSGWSRYHRMSNADLHFLTDFRSQWSGEAGKGKPLVFRTSSMETGRRIVEGIIPQSADRTDENRMVRIAMAEIMKRVGDGIRGVEFISDPKRSTRSFRLIFGQPCFEGTKQVGFHSHVGDFMDASDRMFPMMDLRLSASGVVTPEVTLGIWRLWCRNGCMDGLLPDAFRWRGGSTDDVGRFRQSMAAMAEIAIPFGNLLGERCNEIYDAKLDMSPTACINRMLDLNAVTSAHGDQALNLFDHGYADGVHNGDGQWGMFNALTEAAKVLTPIDSRKKAEARAMTLAMQADGFNGVCKHGLSRRRSEDAMKRVCESHPVIGSVMARLAEEN